MGIHRRRGEGGSLPMAMLAIIVVTGMVTAFFATAMSGTRQVRTDRSFNLAINGAEAGVQQALTRIIQTTPGTTSLDSSAVPAAERAVGAAGFEWQATKVTPALWRIRATGNVDGVERTLETEATRDLRFFVAAFSHLGFDYNGGNDSDSYNDSTLDGKQGSVGTNGNIRFKGNADADKIYLFGSDATCDGAPCPVPRPDPCPDCREVISSPDAYDVEGVKEMIAQEAAAACTSYTDWTYGDYDLVGGTTYCFNKMTFPSKAEYDLVGATIDNPVKVYMPETGILSFGNQSQVNCAVCDTTGRPDSGALQIYSLGQTVEFGNHVDVAMALEAPNATCDGIKTSDAQTEIYGSLICNSVDNQGGWEFHYDESLLNLASGEFELGDVREEVGGSTSFTSP